MAGKPWEEKEVPWCTVCLVTAIVLCHLMVLMGNMSTAGAFSGIGTSTKGWSGVGLDLSASLRGELDEIMVNVTAKLSDAINHTLQVQEMIDLLIGLTGSMTDNVSEDNATKAVMLQASRSTHHAVSLGYAEPVSIGAMSGLILGSVDQVIDQLMSKLIAGLDKLLVVIKPALLQVGAFIIKFGDKVQAILESFSNTLDKVQKIFDQVMTSMASSGGSAEDVFHATYGLFDYTNSDNITSDMLSLAANTYKISALEGDKSKKLLAKYDKDESKTLDREEFAGLTEDESLPEILPVALRSFSSRLAEVSGLLAQSIFRDDVAKNLVSYLQLMGAQNRTKVGWISLRLTNASIPSAFTSDVMVNLARLQDDPNSMSTADVGQIVIDTMMSLNPKYTLECYNQLSNSSYWHTEGYDPKDQPTIIERVTKFVTQASAASASGLLQTLSGEESLAGENSPVVMLEQEVLNAMPMIAKKHTTKNMKAHANKVKAEKDARYNELFGSKTSQSMLVQLLGGNTAADTSSSSSKAARAVLGGALAVPATLEFAKFLSWNASHTANRFQGFAFNNTGKSSNSIDGFAAIIQGMVKKIQAFIAQMEKYSTPAGVEALEEKVHTFAVKGLGDLSKIAKKQIGKVVNHTAPMIDKALPGIMHDAGMALGHTVGEILGTPIGAAMKPIISQILAKLAGNGNSSAFSNLADMLDGIVKKELTDVSEHALGKVIGDQLEKVVYKALGTASETLKKVASPNSSLLQVPVADLIGPLHLHHTKHNNKQPDAKEIEALQLRFAKVLQHAEKASQLAFAAKKGEIIDHQSFNNDIKLLQRSLHEERLTRVRKAASSCPEADSGLCVAPPKASLLATLEEELEEENPAMNSGAWNNVVQMLKSLQNLLPTATDNLKFARKEVSALEKNLDSIFMVFEEKGSPLFEEVASSWRVVWILYFCFMAPLTCVMLFYGFWAGGYFGGPGTPPIEEEEVPPERYAGICGKFHACCDACCSCLCNTHDTTICFWSILIILEIFVLVLFLISLVFVLFSGIKMFLASGCASIYVLGDQSICGETLSKLRSFLATFQGTTPDHLLSEVCDKNQLLTCQMIGEKMQMSSLYTSAGSFLAAVLSFQMLIESAMLHTRAVERRRLSILLADKK